MKKQSPSRVNLNTKDRTGFAFLSPRESEIAKSISTSEEDAHSAIKSLEIDIDIKTPKIIVFFYCPWIAAAD